MDGISPLWLDRFVAAALDEDLGATGDLTSTLLFPPGQLATGRFEGRAPGVLAGGPLVARIARSLDPAVEVRELLPEGTALERGMVVARTHGPIRALLAAERLTLNLLSRMSGIATLTRTLVEAAGGTLTVLDTRKTTPLLRPLERYAVRVGGGTNHRYHLAEAAMIKDNHKRAVPGGLPEAIRRARAGLGPTRALVVECETEAEADLAIAAGADHLLLDNMDAAMLARIASRHRDRAFLEASGGISASSLPTLRTTGVHAVSSGALTHSAIGLDLAFEIEPEGHP